MLLVRRQLKRARPMKRTCPSLTFSLLFITWATVSGQMDLDEDNLIGPVQAVRVQTAHFSNQSGQWIEKPRESLATTITYDGKGKRIEEKIDLTATITHTYDAQGRRLETLSSYVGSPDQKIVYTYDAQGRLSTKVLSDPSGPLWRTVYTYDDKGNPVGETVLGPDGDVRSQSEHIYNEDGKRTETTSYNDHDAGVGIAKLVTTYDARGNIKDITAYHTRRADGEEDEETPIPPPGKLVFTYEFDTQGNWVRKIQATCDTTQSGQLVCEPAMVTYRAITYYSER
jgi:hypothetical protein